ncbi:uncharacterized protein LOC111060407 [Nilaparvata lugens]|uniref:uncharacterized protein LOC111060407 n=1 Tax=Nilaparvata lugens TaxID=108931 RepID=UPI00193E4E8E|nr:uncharacterized protein LOC111060407 [Nilaparvata lugens]
MGTKYYSSTPQKGNTTDCENYRAVCLSSVVCKVYTRILEKRLRSVVEEQLEEEQCAFRPGRQTQDHIFSIRSICSKSIEKGKQVYLAFLDLRAAFDTVSKEALWETLAAKNVPQKLQRAIKSVFNNVTAVVRTCGQISGPLQMRRGIKQGDSLSPLLFTMVMDEIHKICKRRTGRMTVGHWNLRPIFAQALLFADDIVLIADSERKLKAAVIEWNEEIKRKGMELNINKSKVMVVNGTEGERVIMEVEGRQMEQVKSYEYLGTIINEDGKLDEELRNRINKASRAYYGTKDCIFGKKEVGTMVKNRVYKSIIEPIVLYAVESWPMKTQHMSRVRAVAMKCHRRTAGRTLRDRVRSDRIREEIGMKDVKEVIDRKQLGYWGHVQRMDDERKVKQYANVVVGGRRKRGRPRYSYDEHIRRLGEERGRLWGR